MSAFARTAHAPDETGTPTRAETDIGTTGVVVLGLVAGFMACLYLTGHVVAVFALVAATMLTGQARSVVRAL